MRCPKETEQALRPAEDAVEDAWAARVRRGRQASASARNAATGSRIRRGSPARAWNAPSAAVE